MAGQLAVSCSFSTRQPPVLCLPPSEEFRGCKEIGTMKFALRVFITLRETKNTVPGRLRDVVTKGCLGLRVGQI